MPYDFYIEPISLGSRGYRYRVTSADGEVLNESCRVPGYDTCRVLLDRGITGEARMFGKGEVSPRLLLDIERDAKWTISETDKGIRRVKWSPFAPEITA